MYKAGGKIPDNPEKLLAVFLRLCEEYADERDHQNSKTEARENLLDFCGAYAYKLNEVKPWT